MCWPGTWTRSGGLGVGEDVVGELLLVRHVQVDAGWPSPSWRAAAAVTILFTEPGSYVSTAARLALVSWPCRSDHRRALAIATMSPVLVSSTITMPPLAPRRRPDRPATARSRTASCGRVSGAGRRPASPARPRAGRRGSCGPQALSRTSSPGLPVSRSSYWQLEARDALAVEVGGAEDALAPGRRSGRIASPRYVLMPFRSSAAPCWRSPRRPGGPRTRTRRWPEGAARAGARESAVVWRGLEVEDRGQAVGGADRIEDAPGIGPDRRLWDRDGKVLAVPVEDGAALGRDHFVTLVAASPRRSGTPRPRPSAAARCVRAGARSRRGRRRGRRPGGGGCARCARCGSGGPAAPGASDAAVAVGGRLPTGWTRRAADAFRHGSCPVVSFNLAPLDPAGARPGVAGPDRFGRWPCHLVHDVRRRREEGRCPRRHHAQPLGRGRDAVVGRLELRHRQPQPVVVVAAGLQVAVHLVDVLLVLRQRHLDPRQSQQADEDHGAQAGHEEADGAPPAAGGRPSARGGRGAPRPARLPWPGLPSRGWSRPGPDDAAPDAAGRRRTGAVESGLYAAGTVVAPALDPGGRAASPSAAHWPTANFSTARRRADSARRLVATSAARRLRRAPADEADGPDGVAHARQARRARAPARRGLAEAGLDDAVLARVVGENDDAAAGLHLVDGAVDGASGGSRSHG